MMDAWDVSTRWIHNNNRGLYSGNRTEITCNTQHDSSTSTQQAVTSDCPYNHRNHPRPRRVRPHQPYYRAEASTSELPNLISVDSLYFTTPHPLPSPQDADSQCLNSHLIAQLKFYRYLDKWLTLGRL